MDVRKTLILTDSDVKQVLTYKDAFETCDNTFKWMGEGKVQQEAGDHIYYDPEKDKNLFFYKRMRLFFQHHSYCILNEEIRRQVFHILGTDQTRLVYIPEEAFPHSSFVQKTY